MVRRGRKARLDQGASPSVVNRGPFLRRVPFYDLLGTDDLAAIEAQADWILSEVGIDLLDDPVALALFDGAGARVADGHVFFPPGLAQSKAVCGNICMSLRECRIFSYDSDQGTCSIAVQ